MQRMTDKMISDVKTQFDECRHIVRREIYRPVQGAHTDDAPNAPPSKYMQVDLMYPAAIDGYNAERVFLGPNSTIWLVQVVFKPNLSIL
ncbi:hypothetical protein FAM09_23240 [Niastella caeni]|uniref:Uncharacterized protein n=1 Tax=Niastella caeni TaxID=2569763 RepID=A0A4S8HJW7_9BACT|nr:hypothetical protein [Niastella caeni]THU34911.1 hypothetical protein FAM09_23240 [Niastella caeni]